jgi:hypothetical protein
MISKKMDKMMAASAALALLTFVSCGGYNNGKGSSYAAPTPQPQQQQPSPDAGIYQVTFTPMNTVVSGNVAGTANITIVGDSITISDDVMGTTPNTIHHQYVYVANNCPNASSDLNHDGFIDILEGVPSYGLVLVPLDGDLSSQAAGSSVYPISDAAGSFAYTRSAAFSQLMADLHTADTDPTDLFAKLPSGNNLDLASRVIVLHGVADATVLPNTISTVNGLTSHQSLPIACGKISRTAEGSTSGGTTTGGTTVGGTATGGTTVGGTVTGGATVGGTATGGTTVGGITVGGITAGGTTVGGITGGGTTTSGISMGDTTGSATDFGSGNL